MLMRLVLATPILLLTATTAHGQDIVHCINCTDEITTVLDAAVVAANWVSQLEQMRQHYQQLVYTVESLKHPNPGSLDVAQGLLNNATRLPGSAAAEMRGMNYGSNLSGAGQPFYDQNHYYTPQGNDWTAQEMQRRQYATANLQGEAQTGLTTIQARLASLTELENSIPAQPDIQATAAFNARINAEKMYLANETNHVQNLQLLQQTQARVDQQRAEQHGRKEAEDWAAAVAGQAWGN
jgi:type IV secretion system protein VirB5